MLFSGQMALAQDTGIIKGKITDTSYSVAGAVIMVDGSTKLGGLTDVNGNFIIKDVPAGTHTIQISYFGYESYTVENVVVESGKTTDIPTVILKEEVKEAETVVVVGKKIKNEASEKTAVQDTKKSEKIISVLSAEQILKGQDRDAAEAVRRIPGVSLVDNRFIMIRGLSQRYNSVFLNDAGAPSSETDSKAFSFDIIPSQLIDKIQVYKTAAADLPGDFAGGMVKVYTKASVTKNAFQVYAQGSYRPGSTFNTFNATSGGNGADLFGFGGKARDIPSDVPATPAIYDNLALSDKYSISKSFANTWGIKNRTALPDMRINIYRADLIKLGRVDFSNTFNINYANLNTVYNIRRKDWDSPTVQTLSYNDRQSTNTARLGIIENLGFRFSKNFNIEFRNLFNQFGVQQNTVRTGSLNGQDTKAYALSYEARSLYTSQFTGDVETNNKKTKYNWSIGYSYSYKSIPDLRRIKYTKPTGSPDSDYAAQVPPGTVDPVNGGGRFYSKLNEKLYSHNQNFKQNIISKTNVNLDANVGSYVEYKTRSFAARSFGYVIAPAGLQLAKQPIGQIFSNQNVGHLNGFTIDEITDPSYAYTAQNMLIAPYLSASAKFIKRINLLAGVRYEHNIQSLQSYVSTSPVDTSVKTRFLLPSANASFNFTDKSLIRLAYGKTLNRPEFREWSPFYFYSFDFNAGTYGSLYPSILNPQGNVLKVCQIHNFDVRYEFYPSSDEMITIGAFYKKLINPIQQVVLNSTDDSKSFTFANGQSAYIAGVEIDIRKNLAFLKNTRFLNNLNLVSNLSLIKSQVTNTNVIDQNTKTPLQGQSPYIINAGLYFQDDTLGLQVSLLYNVFGPRIFLFGTKGYPSWIEMPRNSLDLTVSQRLSKRASLTAGIQDILNQAVLIIQDSNNDGKYRRPPRNNPDGGSDKEIMRYKKGSYFTIGLKINL